MSVYRLEELFPMELQARLAERPVLVLPFGTIEWHSHHLPVGLDGLVAQAIGVRIADRCDAVLAPLSYWAAGGVPYPYTLNLTAASLEPLYQCLYEQFGAMGFQVILAFTGHFGLEQTLVLKRAAVAAMLRSPVTIVPLTEYDLVTDAYTGDHAGPGETSLLWALRPDLVRLGAVPSDSPLEGVIGPDPRGSASAERGEQLLETIATRAAEVALRCLSQSSSTERDRYREALGAGVSVLEKTWQLRQTWEKGRVPPVTTPAYLAYCQALQKGDYRAAIAHAEEKLADLTA